MLRFYFNLKASSLDLNLLMIFYLKKIIQNLLTIFSNFPRTFEVVFKFGKFNDNFGDFKFKYVLLKVFFKYV